MQDTQTVLGEPRDFKIISTIAAHINERIKHGWELLDITVEAPGARDFPTKIILKFRQKDPKPQETEDDFGEASKEIQEGVHLDFFLRPPEERIDGPESATQSNNLRMIGPCAHPCPEFG